jgi:Zn-dependent M32 family carboxypeptidase
VKSAEASRRATFFWQEASLSKIFSLFQLDLMNLFELNTRLAVKLNQSFETLYNLDYNEYSLILNIVNKDTEEANKSMSTDFIPDSPSGPVKVNLPDHLKLK